MTSKQEMHLVHIQSEFVGRVGNKYRKGAKEHGGDLRDMTPLQLAENALDECIDQFTYLLTLRDNLLILENQASPDRFLE